MIWGSVTLSDQFFSSMDLNVRVINQPTGYASGNITPGKVSVKLKAKGWQLFSLMLSSEKFYYVSADRDSGKITVDPFNEISENNWISGGISITEITPRQVSFKVEKLKFKRLKIEANADLSFSDGFGLATPVRVYPDSVLVAGPTSILDKLSSIKTRVVKLSSLDNQIKVIADIEEPEGFQLEFNKAELTFDVQRIVEESFNNIKVTITDVPKDRDVVLIPNIISCSLRGGINILGKIDLDQISASLDYKEIVYDTLGSVEPKISIPGNTQLVYIKPARLSYIIKKFE